MTAPDPLREEWVRRWPEAVGLWSRWVQLREPLWCATPKEAKREGLTGSFAMLRLGDKSVVIALDQVRALGLEGHPLEVLAHEAGHHVYCPADLTDQGRLLARIRRSLPTKERHAGLVANLYADMLINDRLQRQCGLDMAGLYRKLGKGPAEGLWQFYMRTYEVLWGLKRGTLTLSEVPDDCEGDARLAARLARNYSKDWLGGAGRYAALCFTYLLKEPEQTMKHVASWEELSATDADGNPVLPDGLAEMEPEEIEGAVHPSSDETQPSDAPGLNPLGSKTTAGAHERSPIEYRELLEALGARVSEVEAARRYYKEKAVPHLVPFPVKETLPAGDPLPEGLETWDAGSPVEEVDWFESAAKGGAVVPGYTTVRRTWGVSPGDTPERVPLDLYIGIDCSGSMVNPRLHLSYPVLAGAVIALSALRAGARVMACLSGEPGRALATRGFTQDEIEVLSVLTDYLGTGYTYAVPRLWEGFPRKAARPAHIFLVTDFDIFSSLAGSGGEFKGAPKTLGWDIAKAALERAGGGGTIVLHAQAAAMEDARVKRLRKDGWEVHAVSDLAQMTAFARAFARKKYA
ncbi:VWA domain-containing protein [bacterium]|nr:MAG: VWA domain-containing protein [bacterium]